MVAGFAQSLLEIAILDVNVLRYGIAALTVAVTLGFALRQLLKRQRVSDIVDWRCRGGARWVRSTPGPAAALQ